MCSSHQAARRENGHAMLAMREPFAAGSPVITEDEIENNSSRDAQEHASYVVVLRSVPHKTIKISHDGLQQRVRSEQCA